MPASDVRIRLMDKRHDLERNIRAISVRIRELVTGGQFGHVEGLSADRDYYQARLVHNARDLRNLDKTGPDCVRPLGYSDCTCPDSGCAGIRSPLSAI